MTSPPPMMMPMMKPGYNDELTNTNSLWSLSVNSSEDSKKKLSMKIMKNMSQFGNVNFTLKAEGKENLHLLDKVLV